MAPLASGRGLVGHGGLHGIRGPIAEIVVTGNMGAGLGCCMHCKVGGITFDMEHHVNGNKAENGMGVHGTIVEKLG